MKPTLPYGDPQKKQISFRVINPGKNRNKTGDEKEKTIWLNYRLKNKINRY